jgi:hypothetical protein
MDTVTEAGGVKPPVVRRVRLTDYDTSNLVDLPSLKFEDNGRWREHAQCKGQPDLTPIFFTENAQRNNTRAMMVEKAQVVCAQCTVRKECFNFAKQNDMRNGVWGGVDFFISTNSPRKYPFPDSVD